MFKKSLFTPRTKAIPTLNNYGFMLTTHHEYSQAFIDYAQNTTCPVLDIGCTYGFTALAALNKGATVIANDIDEDHLEVLKKNTPSHLQSSLITKVGRIPTTLILEDNSLSAVNASGVLHFLKKEELIQSLDLIFKWLKPGGKLFFSSSTPYSTLFANFLSLYEGKKQQGDLWAGFIEDTSTLLPILKNKIPKEMLLVDEDIVKFLLEEAGFKIEKMGFFQNPFFVNGSIDNEKSSFGAIAIKC